MDRPARLPDEAPEHLQAFVACHSMSVEFDLGELSWLPAPPGSPVDFAACVEVLPGWTPTTATLRVGYGPNGLISIELPIAIVAGRLSVDTGRLPSDVERPVVRWVTRFNDTLTDNDKELDELCLSGSRLTVTKRSVAPATGTAGGIVAPPAGAATASPQSTRTARRLGTRSIASAAVVLAALTLGGLGWALARRGDDAPDEVAAPGGSQPIVSSSVGTTTTVSPAAAGAEPEQVDPSDGETVVCGQLDGTFATRDDLSDLPPCDQMPPDNYRSCSPALPCATQAGPPFVAFGGRPGTDHSRSVPDADTGIDGASTGLFGLVVVAPNSGTDWTARVQSECSGALLTGEATVAPGLTVVEQPLQSFGPCRVVETSVTSDDQTVSFPPGVWDDDGNYVVDDAEFAAAAPDGLGRLTVTGEGFTLAEAWADSAIVVQNALAIEVDSDRCFSFVESANVERMGAFEICPSGPDSIFVAGETDEEYLAQAAALGTTATQVVAFNGGSLQGRFPGADPDDWTSQSAFPCGPGHVGLTICASDDATPLRSPIMFVQIVFDDTIPLDGAPERTLELDFGADGGAVWSLAFDADGRSLHRSDDERTLARAIVRNDSVTIVIPSDELPPTESELRYIIRSSIGGANFEQPITSMGGRLALPLERPAIGDELSFPEFYEQLSTSVAGGDVGFAFDRLHPAVFEAYSESECRAALATFADPDLVISFISEGESGPWVWDVPDGPSIEIADATAVTITLTGRGQTGQEVEAHLARVDGDLYWFTFCR